MKTDNNDLALLLKALGFAAERHRHQRRKDAEASPYINHPIGLANVLANEGGITDIDVLCAALLHDTIEDTETTPDELRAQFGESITCIVLEVTDDKSLPKQERKQMQIEHAPHILTAKEINALPAKEKPFKISDSPGLSIRVDPSGAKYWIATVTRLGKRSTVSLGRWPDVSAIEARRKLAEAKSERAKTNSGVTFTQLARKWHSVKETRLSSSKYSAQIIQRLAACRA
jgi:hypothetical protein